MSMDEIISRAERNIRVALDDYKRHIDEEDYGEIRHVSDEFISRLARDSSIAKQGLRDIFSKSPAWNEDLDAIVINGTRTHDTNYRRVSDLIWEILYANCNQSFAEQCRIYHAMSLFSHDYRDEEEKQSIIDEINGIAPGAYVPGKKLSRVFRDLCIAIGVYDGTAGSKFQHNYAMLADELNAKRINFKLFMSINPAHFLTMSNPKDDERGSMLTSCHSLNNDEYNYNCGCVGYARDEVSFIVFTVDDPHDRESLNNRKTTRQVFAYRPGSGVLLQSRMYNTFGGVYGAAEDSGLYRDLVQREISDLEGAVNLWMTYPSHKDKGAELALVGDGFGGYPDWVYGDFDGHVSVRNDAEPNPDPLVVGAAGLCVVCGKEIHGGLLCDHCENGHICDCCGEWCADTRMVNNSYGDTVYVCEECCEEHYERCDECGDWYYESNMSHIDGMCVCGWCANNAFEQCRECGEVRHQSHLHPVIVDGCYEYVCDDCLDEDCLNVHDSYKRCPVCGHIMLAEDNRCPGCWHRQLSWEAV